MKAFLLLCALAGLAGLTVVAVRLLILRGLARLSEALNLSSKTRGQLLGYATSIPELVVVVSAAWAGVFEAGFWNIASSNIINWILFLAAAVFYRQYRDLRRVPLLDELSFGVLSVAVPVALELLSAKSSGGISLWTALGLAGLFVIYKLLDRVLNRRIAVETVEQERPAGGIWRGVLYLVLGIAAISVAGRFLGSTAEGLITEICMPAWMVGWILGFVTSIPEMSSFFLVFKGYRDRGQAEQLDDTQEALDALVASNMCNLGVILPAGVIVYLLCAG